MQRLACLLSLLLVAGAADAKCNGTSCATQTQTVTVQTVQIVQPSAPIVHAGGCLGSAPVASGCVGSQGAGSSGNAGRHKLLFSGGIIHHGSSAGILHRHKQTASAGFEQTVTTRQWDNRPTSAAVLVLPAK